MANVERSRGDRVRLYPAPTDRENRRQPPGDGMMGRPHRGRRLADLPLRRANLIVAIACVSLLHRQGSASAAGDDPFKGFDAYATAVLEDWKTPGMSLAVVKGGHVVFARGY